MRKISSGQIALFMTLTTLILSAAWWTTSRVVSAGMLGDLRGVALVAAMAFFSEAYAVLVYRAMLCVTPLPEGDIPLASSLEWVFHLHVLFFLVFFNPVLWSSLLLVPFRRLCHIALGARIGDNSHGPGIVLDPLFVEMGANCILGFGSTLISHEIEGSHVAMRTIRIGDGVTIGAGAKILAGVTIGDGAVIAMQAVVKKGTRIPPHEIWGGVPARRIGSTLTPRTSQVAELKIRCEC